MSGSLIPLAMFASLFFFVFLGLPVAFSLIVTALAFGWFLAT